MGNSASSCTTPRTPSELWHPMRARVRHPLCCMTCNPRWRVQKLLHGCPCETTQDKLRGAHCREDRNLHTLKQSLHNLPRCPSNDHANGFLRRMKHVPLIMLRVQPTHQLSTASALPCSPLERCGAWSLLHGTKSSSPDPDADTARAHTEYIPSSVYNADGDSTPESRDTRLCLGKASVPARVECADAEIDESTSDNTDPTSKKQSQSGSTKASIWALERWGWTWRVQQLTNGGACKCK